MICIGHGICDNLAKTTTLATFCDSADVIGSESVNLLRALNVKAEDVRGVSCTSCHVTVLLTSLDTFYLLICQMGIQISKLNTDSSGSAVTSRLGNILQFTKKIEKTEFPPPANASTTLTDACDVTIPEVTRDELPPLPSLNMTCSQSSFDRDSLAEQTTRHTKPDSSTAHDYWPNLSQVSTRFVFPTNRSDLVICEI